MNGFDLSTASGIYVGNTQYSSVYYGSTLIWSSTPQQLVQQISYLENPNADTSHMYISKNFHFIDSHQYRVDAKVHWIANCTNVDSSQSFIIALGKYEKSIKVNGYSIYWHNSGKLYSNGLGISYRNHGDVTQEHVISDTITGLTNEYYLTLYGNIRGYDKRFTNAKIYYVTITDLTTGNVVCNLQPMHDVVNNVDYMLDTTDNTRYDFVALSRYRESSDLIQYQNE